VALHSKQCNSKYAKCFLAQSHPTIQFCVFATSERVDCFSNKTVIKASCASQSPSCWRETMFAPYFFALHPFTKLVWQCPANTIYRNHQTFGMLNFQTKPLWQNHGCVRVMCGTVFKECFSTIEMAVLVFLSHIENVFHFSCSFCERKKSH